MFGRIIVAALCGVFSGTVSPAFAQTAPVHRIPDVPNEILTRRLPLRTGIGRAHDTVSTKSADAQAFYDQGLSYLHSYVWIEAVRSFNEALRFDPQLALAHVGLNFALTELNKPDAARTALEKAIALAPASSAHDRAHVDARVAQVAVETAPADRTRLAAYRAFLDQALETYPDDAELWILRGMAESPDPFERGQGSVASSVPYYQKALALGAVAAHHYLTHAFENSDQFAKAVEHGAAYAAAAPNVPHALHMHGHVLRRTGRIADAVAAFEAADRVQAAYFAAERIPPEYEWHHEHNLDLLGSSYAYLGQLGKAERELKSAFDLPSSLAVQMYAKRSWPEFLIARGRLDEALAAANVLATHPASLVRATGHIELGRVHLAAGRFAAAADQTNAALRDLRSAYIGQALVVPAFQQLQGEFFLRTGEREKGRAMLTEVARTLRALPGPDNWVQALFALEAMARTARAANDLETAEWAARQMIDHDPNYAGGHYALGLVAKARGDQTTLVAELTRAVQQWSGADQTLPELVAARAALATARRP